MTESEKSSSGGSCAKAVCGLLRCALIAAVITAVIFYFYPHRAEQARRLWIPVVIETNGHQSILGETRQFEFWTPSVNTKDYLRRNAGEVDHNEQWQMISNDDVVAKFGEVLHSNVNVLGYRRVEEWGQGHTSFKPGWWWTMNVLSDYSVGDLGNIYHQYWKSPQPVLVEVVDNRGSKDK